MEHKKPSLQKGRHLVSVTPQTLDDLDACKAQIEKDMGVNLSYTQVISYLIKQWKDNQ